MAHRLKRARTRLAEVELLVKVDGATGNFNAHVAAAPEVDWPRFARRLFESLGVAYNPLTIRSSRTTRSPKPSCRRAPEHGPGDFNRDVWATSRSDISGSG